MGGGSRCRNRRVRDNGARGYRCVSDAARSASWGWTTSCKRLFFSAQNDKNHPLEKRQSHSCAILILPVLAPIRDVHDVILGEGANLLDACSHTLPDEVTFEYLSPSIFRLEENAAYHFSNLVT